jgi:hypothetical protein
MVVAERKCVVRIRRTIAHGFADVPLTSEMAVAERTCVVRFPVIGTQLYWNCTAPPIPVLNAGGYARGTFFSVRDDGETAGGSLSSG